ncbi:LOW QUALITY PROTEIN: protein yellow-like [Neocloeon triangulifer]|uniref:LOW QUALITY PROTEIN: protein yellow-like n=1 Tax=Neocloeon triangulifer TaxID=2078957 RepID=UPI00286F549D|nr:LOW QUALITY PROTEIN: protein yellow-like [Neocloeon triangulifer]
MRSGFFLLGLLSVGASTKGYGGYGGVKRPPGQGQSWENSRQSRNGNISQNSQQNRLQEVFSWKQLDFNYPTQRARDEAIRSGAFVPMIPEPIGVTAGSKNRVFISIPRFKNGVPATLTYVNYPSQSSSPLLNPYPNWEMNREGNCDGITSTFRVKVDECDRLWVLDTGLANSFIDPKRICPPQVLTFDLKTDKVINKYQLPNVIIIHFTRSFMLYFNLGQAVLNSDSLHVSIEVEYPRGTCGKPSDAVLYIADTTIFSIIVADLSTGKTWKVLDKTVYPSPEAGTFNIAGESFELMDGVVGMAFGPKTDPGGRKLYFSAMSSFQQRWVQTSILRNETTATNSPTAFQTGAQPRLDQSAGCGMDNNGVLFFGLVTTETLACWNTRNPFKSRYIGKLARDKTTLQFLTSVSVDQSQRLWAISTRLQKFVLETMSPNEAPFATEDLDQEISLYLNHDLWKGGGASPRSPVRGACGVPSGALWSDQRRPLDTLQQ